MTGLSFNLDRNVRGNRKLVLRTEAGTVQSAHGAVGSVATTLDPSVTEPPDLSCDTTQSHDLGWAPYWAGEGVSADGVSSGRGGRGGLSSVEGVSAIGVWRGAAAGRSGISARAGFESFFRGAAGTAAV